LYTRRALDARPRAATVREPDRPWLPHVTTGDQKHECPDEQGGVDVGKLQVRRPVVGTSADLAIERKDVRRRRMRGSRATDGRIRCLQRRRRSDRTGTPVVTQARRHRDRWTHEGPNREQDAREHPSAHLGTQHCRRVLWIGSTPDGKLHPNSRRPSHQKVTQPQQPTGACRGGRSQPRRLGAYAASHGPAPKNPSRWSRDWHVPRQAGPGRALAVPK
jgi:hypothetical protein